MGDKVKEPIDREFGDAREGNIPQIWQACHTFQDNIVELQSADIEVLKGLQIAKDCHEVFISQNLWQQELQIPQLVQLLQ